MAVLPKKASRSIRRKSVKTHKARNLIRAIKGEANEKRRMDSQAVLAAEQVFSLYDKAEARAGRES